VDDNVMIFSLLSDQFPDEHITNCIDARVVSRSHTSVDDPGDPAKSLHTVTVLLECPHLRFEVSLLGSVQGPPG
jgi:hypothetical protein